MGAGVIPFCVLNGTVHFLFQRVFAGRKTGYLIDFGGGMSAGEDYMETAMREFVEETETMFFSPDAKTASRTSKAIEDQMSIIRKLFDETMREHPEWWCRRVPGPGKKPKDWRTYFIEFAFRDVTPCNREWAEDTSGRFKKRRELVWVASDELLDICRRSPDRLWKRVRQLAGLEHTVRSIKSSKEASRYADSATRRF